MGKFALGFITATVMFAVAGVYACLVIGSEVDDAMEGRAVKAKDDSSEEKEETINDTED